MDDIRKVRSVKLYACGCCENELRHVFSGYPSEKRRFPALSVLITHERLGNILYDTGYSELIYENGLVSKIYNSLNRTYISKDETIISKLTKKTYGYKIELSDDVDLRFDQQGNFIEEVD